MSATETAKYEPTARPAIRNTPKTCTRCKGTGQVTFTTYAGGFCMGCGGKGYKEAPVEIIKGIGIEGPFGGSDANIRILHRGPDHRAEVWTVEVYTHYHKDEIGFESFTETFDNYEVARIAANTAYRFAKKAAADMWERRGR